MWYRLNVASKETGEESTWDVECANPEEASHKAEAAGYFIGSISEIPAAETRVATAHHSKPTVGSIVHFVLADGPQRGAHRPAMITNVWAADHPAHPGMSDLIVFKAKADDFITPSPVVMVGAVSFQQPTEDHPVLKPGTWHWPEETEL